MSVCVDCGKEDDGESLFYTHKDEKGNDEIVCDKCVFQRRMQPIITETFNQAEKQGKL
jgi:DNA-directed RNA polymerase subunit RPC12/RpoP